MKHIEIFTAGCPVCEPAVKLVKETAGNKNSITIYDMIKQCNDKVCLDKLNEYEIKQLPAVAIDGQLLDCCRGNVISKEALLAAGIGED